MIKQLWRTMAHNELAMGKDSLRLAKDYPSKRTFYLSICKDRIKLAYRYWQLGQ